jgi:epoxyqueuosine reductase
MTPATRTEYIKSYAHELGLDRCGIADAQPIGRGAYLREFLARGYGGSMEYLSKHVSIKEDPRQLLDGAKSIVVVALSYKQEEPVAEGPGPHGRVAMYAWGDDYHRVLKKKLMKLADGMRERFGDECETRVCVDTAPMLERDVAALAGVGWIGKNTLVMHEGLGSYFFLGEILTTAELMAGEAAADHCGSCRACLDACPTDAFVAPYQMDASRCVSYLTIEHRGDISRVFSEMMGDWVFGCDVCQQVCPFNRDAPDGGEPRFVAKPGRARPDLASILEWDEEAYQLELRGNAMKRAKLPMMKRNAAIAAKNLRSGQLDA